MSVATVEKEIHRTIERGWFEGAAEFTHDLGGVAMPLRVPQRQFAVLVAGPIFRVKPRSQELARIIANEVEKHLGDLLGRDTRKPAASAGR